jgi:predicted nucleotidyltransferase
VKNQKEILEVLRADKDFIQKSFGVRSLALFGSYARDEQTEESDIDFLVELTAPKASFLFGMMTYLEKKLGQKVDVVRVGPHLSERFLSVVKKDLVYV